jgi:hypothetical protein
MTNHAGPETGLIAPCGINCGTCLAFLRKKNRCNGCMSVEAEKVKHCQFCYIRNCGHLAAPGARFCFECSVFPCARMKQLEKRYRIKYNMLIFENFRLIKAFGPDQFERLEKIKWKCKVCGGTICVHRGYCLDCANTRKPEN